MGSYWRGLVILTQICRGQTAPQPLSQAQAVTSTQTVIADGAVDPSKIPDEIAFTHFFRVLAKDSHANEQADQAKRLSYVKYVKYFFATRCGHSGQDDRSLTDAETAALLNYADRVSTNLAALTASAPTNTQAVLSNTIRAAVLAATADLDQQLGQGVAQKVRSHVADMKSAIRIVQSQIPAAAK